MVATSNCGYACAMAEKTVKSVIFKWLRFAALLAVVYVANVQLQTWMGKRALEQTELQFLGIAAGLAQGQREHKPVLVDFSAIWCGNCRVMHQTLFTDTSVKQVLAHDYVLVRVDYDAPDAEGFMQRYDVRYFPSLVVLSGDGTLLRRLPVPNTAAEFVAVLRAPG
ncbi:MAG: hypothetical protein COZ47_10145 [Lysobacterales bacterium CG_4_10_14_3_um_filter_64_11]|nr:MAG: hypothetical protein COZ47_10145 [Xanthomonadales bacterium CG_4_10_14_3_um_filter_64_11]